MYRAVYIFHSFVSLMLVNNYSQGSNLCVFGPVFFFFRPADGGILPLLPLLSFHVFSRVGFAVHIVEYAYAFCPLKREFTFKFSGP